jgi:hypothetical protein
VAIAAAVLISALITGLWTVIEAVLAFESYAPDVWKVGRYPLAIGFLGFGLYGAAWCGALFLLKYPAQLQIAGHAPSEWAIAFTAPFIAQVGRIEITGKAEVPGLPHIRGDRQSLYARTFRFFLVNLYRALLRGVDDQKRDHLLGKGLTTVFSARDLAEELQTWANAMSDEQQAEELKTWIGNTLTSIEVTEEQKRRTLVLKLLHDDPEHARPLAETRAVAIVDQRAF